MPNSAAIGLTQLVLWYDATRIQAWPVLLTSIPEDLILRSATDFGRRFETQRMTDTRHAAAEKIVRNLPGLECRKGRLVLKGLGLLTLTPEGYRLSHDGSLLKQAYLSDPRGKEWARLLGRLLLMREPRTRVLMRLLSQPEAELVFDGDGWFAGSVRRAHVKTQSGLVFPFVGDHPEYPSLRTLLREHSWWSLGEWRSDRLLDGTDNCHYTGTLQKELSLHDVSLALRGAFEILLHLGVLDISSDRCRLNPAACARELGKDLAADLGWASDGSSADIEAILAGLIGDLRSDTGYVIASEIREGLRRAGIPNPDGEIARLQAEGRLVIESEEYGQPRHGEGLFGEPRKQMVQLRLLSRSHS